jgi:hypothetical protein
MRIRAGTTSSGWRLFEDGKEIGYIRDSEVGFAGFTSQMDAAQAAYAAHRALARRRAKSTWTPSPPDEFLLGERGEAQYVIERSGLLARLYEPEPGAGRADWGFEVTLRPEESLNVFAMSRARIMWSALRASGYAQRMRQFTAIGLGSDADRYARQPKEEEHVRSACAASLVAAVPK